MLVGGEDGLEALREERPGAGRSDRGGDDGGLAAGAHSAPVEDGGQLMVEGGEADRGSGGRARAAAREELEGRYRERWRREARGGWVAGRTQRGEVRGDGADDGREGQ